MTERLKALRDKWRTNPSIKHPSLDGIIRSMNAFDCADELDAEIQRLESARNNAPPYKGPIDRPCSACSAGDTEMKYHNHEGRASNEGAALREVDHKYAQELAEGVVIRWLKRPMDGSEEPAITATLIVRAALEKFGERVLTTAHQREGSGEQREHVGKDGRSHFRVTSGDCVCGWSIINDFEWRQHLQREGSGVAPKVTGP